MLISKAKFKMSSMDFTNDFVVFAHYYQLYLSSRKKYDEILAHASSLPESRVNESKAQYEKAVQIAANKILVLDRRFYSFYNEHLVAFLEGFNEMEAALNEVSELLAA